MGTSVYFNNQEARVEQSLLEDLIIESIRNHGIDVYYLPRRSQSVNDALFGDDPVKTFTDAYPIEMFLESAKDYEGKAIVGKVNVDHNPNISMNFGIRNIPTLLFFKGGQVVDKQVGAVPKSVLANKLDAQMA